MLLPEGPIPALGELLALLFPVFALFGSEFTGVGCSSKAERLALLVLGGAPMTPLTSECELRGGDTDMPLGGGVAIDGAFCDWLGAGSGPCTFREPAPASRGST